MTLADTNIAALRTGHDRLAALISRLSEADLAKPSGSSEWEVAQVLSHLGSGAVIGLATVRAALEGKPNPGRDFNLGVWDRWNSMERWQYPGEFLQANQEFTELYEAMPGETRQTLQVDMGFLPAPVDVASAARLRLSELALHSWDAHVAFDPEATVAPEATSALLRNSGDLLGWIAKADRLQGRSATIRVVTSEPEAVFTLRLGESIGLDFDSAAEGDGELRLPAESWLRLVAGRLSPAHTPAEVQAGGSADLELLRQVFPGY